MSLLITRYLSILAYDKALLVARLCEVGHFVMFSMLAATCIFLTTQNMALSNQLNKANDKVRYLNMTVSAQEQQYATLEGKYAEVEEKYNTIFGSFADMVVVANQLDTENQEVKAAYDEQSAELQKFQEREELYDKYEYALFRDEDNSRTDIKYDDLKSLETLAKERGMGEDAIDLILTITQLESNGYADAQNPKSSAAGLAGLIKSTAKSIYTTELGSPYGPYKHNPMAYDSELNLEIGLSLIDVLAEDNNRDVAKTVLYYRGTEDEAYQRKLERLIKNNTGKNLYDLDI